MGKVQLPPDETLKDHLTPAVYSDFTRHAEDTGMPMWMLDRFKPAMAAMTLEVFALQKLGANPEYGVDKYFYERAHKAEKQIVPLETVDFQIGLVTEFSKEEGELLMKTTLEEIDNTKKAYTEMLAAWRSGDAVKLEKLLNEAEKQAPALYKRLVTDRNARFFDLRVENRRRIV